MVIKIKRTRRIYFHESITVNKDIVIILVAAGVVLLITKWTFLQPDTHRSGHPCRELQSQKTLTKRFRNW
jgi:hypothetical protein